MSVAVRKNFFLSEPQQSIKKNFFHRFTDTQQTMAETFSCKFTSISSSMDTQPDAQPETQLLDDSQPQPEIHTQAPESPESQPEKPAEAEAEAEELPPMKVPEIDFESVSTMRAKELHALIKSTNTMSKRMKVSAIETIESIKSEEKQAREDLKAQEKKNRDELKERFVKAREEAFTQYKETQALLKQLREANETRKSKSKSSSKSSPKPKRGIESTVIYKEGHRFGSQSSQDGTNQVKATQLETLIGVTIPKGFELHFLPSQCWRLFREGEVVCKRKADIKSHLFPDMYADGEADGADGEEEQPQLHSDKVWRGHDLPVPWGVKTTAANSEAPTSPSSSSASESESDSDSD